MKKSNIKIEANKGGYALYINGYYTGTFSKTIINIKLRAHNLPEVE